MHADFVTAFSFSVKMASAKKRAAGTYITHDNWDKEDEEDEPQEQGTFAQANEDVLSARVIKKAKRRVGSKEGRSSEEEGKTFSNPFSAFGGFGKTTIPSVGATKPITVPNPVPSFDTNREDSKSSVSGFWKSSTDNQTDFFANRGTTSLTSATEKIRKISEESKKEMFSGDKNNNNKLVEQENKTEMSGSNNDGGDEYYQQVSALNISVMNWIKNHVDDNPCIDLQPVFRDYEKYMKDIEAKYRNKKETVETTKSNFNVMKTPESSHQSPIGFSSNTATNAPSLFSNLKSSTPIFSATSTEDVKASNNKLFNTQSPFSFKPTTPSIPETVKEETNGGSEENQPEQERKTIVEKDAFHQIRCKLFFKKWSEWKELGIGMLYLKPSSSDEKVQLLVRMETSTGKVLLNITVTKDIPVSRSGKNNVMVVSIPNPPVYTKPTDGDNSKPCTYLIRVKGTTEADDLYGKLKK